MVEQEAKMRLWKFALSSELFFGIVMWVVAVLTLCYLFARWL